MDNTLDILLPKYISAGNIIKDFIHLMCDLGLIGVEQMFISRGRSHHLIKQAMNLYD